MSLSKLHGGSSSSSATACAACKYQRKKCTGNCILARYFPQERQTQFLNAHKLFGVSNITKLIKGVEEQHRDTAMNNLIFHSNARALDPVGGLYKIVCDLKRKIDFVQAEINSTHQKIAACQTIAFQEQQQHFGCFSYGDLLEQGEEYVNIDHQNQIMQKQSPLNYEMEIPINLKLEKQKNLVNQTPMPLSHMI